MVPKRLEVGSRYTAWMRIMVLQARRTDDPMLEHERECFIASTGHAPESFDWRNVAEGVPRLVEVQSCDALLIGGSGHFSVADPSEDFFAPLEELLRGVVDSDCPTFGSCFGYQLLVSALGGRVAHDEDRGEVGSFEVELTSEGNEDELFGTLPTRFTAQMGHLDRAVVLPDGVRNLARSELCPYQALRVEDRRIWASQFHPELDQAANRHRFLAYIERYDPSGGDAEFNSQPSPETSRLLPRFLRFLDGEKM
jgi:GMP synthase (glutamine-hydrolysing)